MCSKPFGRRSWSWSSFFSSSASLQKTMTICVASRLGGDLGHGHRLFLSHLKGGILGRLSLGARAFSGVWGGARGLLLCGSPESHLTLERCGYLVAQCSATPASVAATPPCSATPLRSQLDVRDSWHFKGDRLARPFIQLAVWELF